MDATTPAPAAQDPTAITYSADDHRYVVTAHGIVMAREWDMGAAELARLAWLTVYEAERATTPSIIVTSVRDAERLITRVTGGEEIVWHASALRSSWAPAEGTRFAAIMIGREIELWAFSADGRLGSLEVIYEERRPSLVPDTTPLAHHTTRAQPDTGRSAAALAPEVSHAA